MAKTTKTFSVETDTYKLFEKTCKKNNTNKSAYLEKCVKNYLQDNLGYNNEELYYLRSNDKYVVSIEEKDDTFFKLSDGSTISQILFYQTFNIVEKVDSDCFFNQTYNIVEKVDSESKK
jgi:hypothetical protein